MLQITQHAERLALLDQREATHFRETAERLADVARALAEVSGQVGDVHDVATRQSALLDTLDGLDKQVATLATRLTAMTDSRSDVLTNTSPFLPPAGGSSTDGTARKHWPGSAPGSSRSTAPATATSPPPSAPAGTSTPSASTDSTGSWSCGPSSISLPSATPQPSPAKPNGKPASCPPSPNSSTSKPPGASTLRRPRTGGYPTQPILTTVGARLTGARALHRDHRSHRGRAGAPQLSPGRPTVTANGPSEDRLHR